MPLSHSPAVTAFVWLRDAVRSPSPVALVLVGAALPFLGGLVGYVHQEHLAEGQAHEAQAVRNQQQANEVFTEVSKRLGAIRVIQTEVAEAAESKSDSALRGKSDEFVAAVREWTLSYPRVRALAETYYGKPLGDYLDSIDEELRKETVTLPNLAKAELEVRRLTRKSDSLEKLLASTRIRRTPEQLRSAPAALKRFLVWQDAKIDSMRVERRNMDQIHGAKNDTIVKLTMDARTLDARAYKIMASQIRDGLVGFTDEERDRAIAQETIPGQLGIYPFDPGIVFYTFTLLAIAVIAAYRLAALTGRNPWPWSVGAALFAAPVLLFLLLAPPSKPTVIAEPEVKPEKGLSREG